MSAEKQVGGIPWQGNVFHRLRGRSFPAVEQQVPPKLDHHFRLFSLNVAHGRRQVATKPYVRRRSAWRSMGDIAQTVRQLRPDVVALQEADGPSAWSGNFDHVATVAERARLVDHFRGDHNPFRWGPFQLASGTALLSKMRLIDPRSHRFGLSWRDTKGFVAAGIEVPAWDGRRVDVVSVHLDFLTPSMRQRQICQMIEVLAPRRRPLVILGDLNCCWQHEPESMELLTEALELRTFRPDWSAPTYPTYRPRRRFDWILISEELTFGSYQTVHAPLSDHLILVADLELPHLASNRT